MSDNVTHTLTVTMDASIANTEVVMEMINKLKGVDRDSLTYTLSETPQVGDKWKDCNGNEYILQGNTGVWKTTFPLADQADRETTFRENGQYSCNQLSRHNLTERVAKVNSIEINNGEFWMDRAGDIHHVRVTHSGGIYCVDAINGPCRTWMRNGMYNVGMPNHHRDLIKKMVFADDCNKQGDTNV
jgi:hypothetical protein